MSSIRKKEMFYGSMYDPNLYNVSNEQNCMFITAYKTDVIYKKNPKTVRPTRVQVTFTVDHQLVQDHIPDPSHRSGDVALVSRRSFNQPLRALASAGDAGPVFEAMLSKIEIPFDLRTREAPCGPLIWGLGFPGEWRLVDDVAAELSRAGERILREVAMVGSRGAVKEIRIIVCIRKRTFVGAGVYRWTTPHTDEFGYDDDEEAAVESPETETETEDYDGDEESENESECSICLDELSIGTRVIQVACSHWFHEDCIVPWSKKIPTCPLCRFELDPEALDTN